MKKAPLALPAKTFLHGYMSSENERIDKINDDITLIQSKNGLTFTTDAYLLSAYVRRPAGKSVRLLELGAGTGVVSLLLASRGRADKIVALEVQEKFAEIMTRNVENNGFSDIIEPVCMDVRDAAEKDLGMFDAVFSNPPYMRAGSGFESAHGEANIARREVFGGLHDFCAAAGRLCRFGGMFYVVYRPERFAELCSELRSCGFEPKAATFLHPDADKRPSLVFVTARRGGAAGMIVTQPLFAYERGTRNETETFRSIYDTGSFPDEFLVR